MTTTPAQLLTASLLEVFGERDPARRRAAMQRTMDIGIIADGQIATMYTIIEPAP